MHSSIRNIRRAAFLMVPVCALWLLVSGCGPKQTRQQAIERYSEELREAVASHVAEEARRNQMLLIVERLEALHRRFSGETSDFLASYGELNADYDAARAAFEALFADYNAKRVQARTEALDLHFQLASLATGDEWRAIGKAEAELYEEVIAARPAEAAK